MIGMATDTIQATDIETLPILMAPHPLLKTRTRKVTPADAAEVAALLPRMFATMYKAPGIGLAAPQIGVSLRLAVVDLMPDEVNAPIVLINPEIIAVSDEQDTREEGCLSLPGQYADVTRPARVKVRYFEPGGARKDIEADGLAGRLPAARDRSSRRRAVRRSYLHAEAQHDHAQAGQGTRG